MLQLLPMSFNIVFMGSPEFALPTLRLLAQNYRVVGVVTQPDRPAGRGRVMTPPPIKVLAQELGIETIQPERMKEPGAQEKLRAWSPDVIVVAAFGQILRKSVLELPPYGCINVHASLLPRWRGAAPVQAAILHGDPVSGATIMQMDPGIDTGRMLAQGVVEIRPDDTAETLSARLSVCGAELLIQTLPGYLSGEVQPRVQDESQATYAPMIQKEEGLLDFGQPAEALERRIRAFSPWPGAYLPWQEGFLKIHRAHVEPYAALKEGQKVDSGQRCVLLDLPAISTSNGYLVFDEVQPPGKKPMAGRDFLRGARAWETPDLEQS